MHVSRESGVLFLLGLLVSTVFALQLLDPFSAIAMQTGVTFWCRI